MARGLIISGNNLRVGGPEHMEDGDIFIAEEHLEVIPNSTPGDETTLRGPRIKLASEAELDKLRQAGYI